MHRYLNPTHGRGDPDLQPWPRQQQPWPGYEWGVRAPTPDEQPLSLEEARLALRLGVARAMKGNEC